MEEHLTHFFNHKRNRPSEEVHEVGKKVGMRTLDELLNVESVVLYQESNT